MSYLRTVPVLGLLIVLNACALDPPEMVRGLEGLISDPKPVFPRSERERDREGWVIVAYTVAGSGLVRDVRVSESSGNRAFEEAATSAVGRWRYRPGDVRELTTLVTFTIDGSPVRVSIGFMTLNQLAHEFIDIGRLEGAEALLAEMRSKPHLTPYELAYSYLAEERIAYERGNRKAQLNALRKAMLSKGRWLAEEAYLECLHTTIALEIEVGDYASALRDYNLLTVSREGRELAADLDPYIEAVEQRLQGAERRAKPYLVADSGVAVNKTRSRRGHQGWIGPEPANRPASRTTTDQSSSSRSLPPPSPRPPPPVRK